VRASSGPLEANWRGEYDESLVVIGRLLTVEPSSGELLYFQGEATGAAGTAIFSGRAKAMSGRSRSTPHPQAYRGLGLIALKQATRKRRRAFTAHSNVRPMRTIGR
jgi:hypothetical protein